MERLHALSLAAMPGRRNITLDLAVEIEKRGFSGIYAPSMGDSLAFCQALAHVTHTISFGTSIMPIYFRQEVDFASTAAFIHEISGGRFKFGIGVSHAPALKREGSPRANHSRTCGNLWSDFMRPLGWESFHRWYSRR